MSVACDLANSGGLVVLFYACAEILAEFFGFFICDVS